MASKTFQHSEDAMQIIDPNLMPLDVVKTHTKLDKLVVKAYGKSIDSDAEKMVFLFEKYQELTADE
jgi:hypothetical protein